MNDTGTNDDSGVSADIKPKLECDILPNLEDAHWDISCTLTKVLIGNELFNLENDLNPDIQPVTWQILDIQDEVKVEPETEKDKNEEVLQDCNSPRQITEGLSIYIKPNLECGILPKVEDAHWDVSCTLTTVQSGNELFYLEKDVKPDGTDLLNKDSGVSVKIPDIREGINEGVYYLSGYEQDFQEDIKAGVQYMKIIESGVYIGLKDIRDVTVKLERVPLSTIEKMKSGLSLNEVLQCWKCPIQDLKGQLTPHVIVHSRDQPFKSDVCSDTYKCMADADSPKEKVQCGVCGKSMSTKHKLKRHFLIHSSSSTREPFICNVCGKGYPTKYDLYRHSDIHASDALFKCHECGKNFKLKYYLEKHLITHNDNRAIRCHICTKIVNSKSSLNSHLLIHSGEKPFKCQICDMDFRTKSVLTRHLGIHSKVNEFKCTTCKKEFNQKRNLDRHINSVHTHEKTFTCQLCRKVCHRKFHLLSHIQKKHTQ